MKVCIRKFAMNTSPPACMLPKNIFDALELSAEVPYTIHFGLSKQAFLIKFSEVEEKNMYIPENIFNQLLLLENSTLNIWKTDKDIFLGPVVGIFVTKVFMNGIIRNSHKYFVRQHLHAGLAENCLGYFFCPNDIDWAEKKVRGYTYIPELKKNDFYWFPLPNVLYDKSGGSGKKERPLIKKLRRKFKSTPNLKLINNVDKLGKWEVCEALAMHPEANKYVPETITYKSFDDVLYMLNKYKFLFIKSYYGSGGKQVLSLEKLSHKYKLNYYKGGLKVKFLDNINKVQDFVNKFVGSKNFIVQQGLKLLTYNGRSMDIRMFMMKNEFGLWESIFKGCRIAKKGFNITNIHAGGVYGIYEQLYPKLGKQYSLVKLPDSEMLNEVSIMLAGYMEKELGALGEIGIDMAIDTTGQIWMIEANAKPDKELLPYKLDINGKPWVKIVQKFYSGANKNNKVMPQAVGIFKYAKFLTDAAKI